MSFAYTSLFHIQSVISTVFFNLLSNSFTPLCQLASYFSYTHTPQCLSVTADSTGRYKYIYFIEWYSTSSNKMSYSIIPPRTPWQLQMYLLGYELLVNHYLRPHFTLGRVANRVVFSLSCTWQNNHYTNICAARTSVHTLSNASPPTCPQTYLCHCVSCVCMCARASLH